jgi:anti-sigma factor RsiW
MNVTRDVIYDLLPAYFAGEVSADTRALVEEFFATDPDFKRMVERFGALLDLERGGRERPESSTDGDRERETFNQIRARMKLRHAAILWGLSALMALALTFVAATGRHGVANPGSIIGLVFGAMAVATWLASNSRRPDYWHAEFLSGGANGPDRWRYRRRIGR